ncbi:MAG: hypothetical protein KKG76_10815 [Euryarchaeota archaeon]|nr:hypothetical protein [Euryarchaeota archaeon]
MDSDSIHQHGGWGNYFKGGTVKRWFGELDEYIRGR